MKHLYPQHLHHVVLPLHHLLSHCVHPGFQLVLDCRILKTLKTLVWGLPQPWCWNLITTSLMTMTLTTFLAITFITTEVTASSFIHSVRTCLTTPTTPSVLPRSMTMALGLSSPTPWCLVTTSYTMMCIHRLNRLGFSFAFLNLPFNSCEPPWTLMTHPGLS